MVKKLTETVYQESAPRVDVDAGILYGIKVLGETSRNKRRYQGKGMREAVPKYNGTKSYIDHPDPERLNEDRKFHAWAGVFQNARYEEGKGIFADLHLRKTGEHFEGILEAAQKFPTAVGFSHVAEGESQFEGDTEIVESIKEVFSVDLVTDPATTAGFFESKRRKPKTVKAAIESLPEGPQRKRLIEMAGEYGVSDMSMDTDKPSDPFAQIAALCERLVEMLGEALIASKTPPPAPATDTQADDEPAEDEEMKPEDKDKLAAFESTQKENAELKAKAAELEAKNTLLESGRQATPARIKALASATETDRAELLESWPQLDEGQRPLRSPALEESTDASPDRIRETFAALAR